MLQVSEAEFDAMMERIAQHKAALAAEMPTEQDAINTIQRAYERLKELGWNDAIYCPKDGSTFDSIEVGSTGIHPTHYMGEWATGSWWVTEAGDLWPARPTLYRVTQAEKDRWAALGRRYRETPTTPPPPDPHVEGEKR